MNFVLVHGAWHGSWCWARVREALQTAGHSVYTPTLTGLGERAHLLAPEINLSTHIDDVVNLIRWESLHDVVLCGHSYGGAVVTGAADQMAERIRTLVYLDAFVPADGESVHDLLPMEQRDLQVELARQQGEGWKVPPIPAEVFNVNLTDRAWVDRQCTPQPLATFSQKLALTGGLRSIPHIVYIPATDFPATPFGNSLARAQAARWTILPVHAGHDVMIDRPAALTTLLQGAADGALAPAHGP
jgi:pimeloyl-ACP methyl ester carboxylesterase